MRGRPAWTLAAVVAVLVVVVAALALEDDDSPALVGERAQCISNQRHEQRYIVVRDAYERGELGTFEEVSADLKPAVVRAIFTDNGELRDRDAMTAQGQVAFTRWALSEPVRAKTRDAQDRAVATVDRSDCE